MWDNSLIIISIYVLSIWIGWEIILRDRNNIVNNSTPLFVEKNVLYQFSYAQIDGFENYISNASVKQYWNR